MEATSPLLQVDHLNIQYSGMDVVKDVSFTLRRGEILGIIGESGCGKSTLVNAVLGMLDHHGSITGGKIFFHDAELTAMPTAAMRALLGKSIGAVFQNPGASLNPIRKVRAQFYDTIRAHIPMEKQAMEAKIMALLEKLELPRSGSILDRYPVQCSGGMNQRIALALAMILEPELIIGDEPTSALDVTVQAQVVKEMLRLRDTFYTGMLLVTHNMGLISHMVDTVAVMYAGRIVEYGKKEEVMQAPAHPYTKALMAATPLLNGILPKGLPGRRPNLGEYKENCNFAPRCVQRTGICRYEDPPMVKGRRGQRVYCHHPLGEADS